MIHSNSTHWSARFRLHVEFPLGPCHDKVEPLSGCPVPVPENGLKIARGTDTCFWVTPSYFGGTISALRQPLSENSKSSATQKGPILTSLSLESPPKALNLDLEQISRKADVSPEERMGADGDFVNHGHVDVVSVHTKLGVFLRSDFESGSPNNAEDNRSEAAAGQSMVQSASGNDLPFVMDDQLADATLQQKAYPFLKVPYVAPYYDAFNNSRSLPVHAVLLWGRLDDQAC